MKVTLENQAGKIGAKVFISTGERLFIGRNAPAELAGGADPYMSGSHFLIECNQDRCRIADMNSRNGTFVNGNQIKEAVLGDGDLISAGQSRFRVHIEDGLTVSLPEAAADATAVLANETLVLNNEPKDLRQVLSPPPGEHLYAILDAARDDRILEVLRNSQERYQSLYEGQQGEDLANFAPYLVELPNGSPLLDTLIKEGWGNSWGIYLTSEKPFEEIRKHFRHFLLVETEDGRQLYFRFYDPRVLRDVLSNCPPNGKEKLFGPVHSYLIEGSRRSNVWRFICHSDNNQKKGVCEKTQIKLWKIGQEQMQSLSRSSIRKFEDRMIEQLQDCFPRLSAKLGESGLRDIIRYGIERSREYGMLRQCDIGRYIAITMMLGPNFERNVSFEPLCSSLHDSLLKSSVVRMQDLCRAAIRTLGNRTRAKGKKPRW